MDLKNDQLNNANLTGTSFYWSDLTGANLSDAVINKTNFTGANLFKAQINDGAQEDAIVKDTGLPDGTFQK